MSILAYIASIIVGIIVAIAANIDTSNSEGIPPLVWYAGSIGSVIFTVLFALWYFHSPKTARNAKEGLKFGVTMIVTGFILDMLTMIPMAVSKQSLDPILTYYLNPWFWLTIILVLAGATITGHYLKPKAPQATS